MPRVEFAGALADLPCFVEIEFATVCTIVIACARRPVRRQCVWAVRNGEGSAEAARAANAWASGFRRTWRRRWADGSGR